jgi:hypothetical protein
MSKNASGLVFEIDVYVDRVNDVRTGVLPGSPIMLWICLDERLDFEAFFDKRLLCGPGA